jgi:hypothetical protein
MKSLKNFLNSKYIVNGENVKVVKQLPDDMVSYNHVIMKIKGHEYLVRHYEEDDHSYGKFHIFRDGEPIDLIDYGVGHKFHGYKFDKKYKAYDALKKYFANL